MQTYPIETYRHSQAHILAQALIRLYPDAKLGIGPVVENGFYYEIETEEDLTEEDFPRIEEEMWSIMKADYPITQLIISKDETYNLLLHQGQIYKTEILEEIEDDEISIFKTGEEFLDLCSGPHVASTAEAGVFKLTKIEEGFWRNQPHRPKMKKIYGVGFAQKKDLLNYLEQLEYLKEIDHRKLGQKLGFYQLSNDYELGVPIWLPLGNTLRQTITSILNEEKKKSGFQEVHTPHILPLNKETLGLTSEELKDKLFPEIKHKDQKLSLRADTTPTHYKIYKSKTRSYRELPLKISETDYVYRDESEHELHGLAKTKAFTLDSNHIFCSEETVFQEILAAYQMATKILKRLGFNDYRVQLATDSENQDQRFTWAYGILSRAIESLKIVSRQIEDKTTEYGPKIEIMVKDLFGKEWQISSIQLDIFSTISSGLTYVNSDGGQEEVVVLRTTFIGSLERIIGLLIEKTGGNLPLALAPEQTRILPVSKRYSIYAEKIKDALSDTGLKVTIDNDDETLQSRIKTAQEDKIPYMLIVGSKEESSGSVSVRPREGQDLGLLRLEEFIDLVKQELTR